MLYESMAPKWPQLIHARLCFRGPSLSVQESLWGYFLKMMSVQGPGPPPARPIVSMRS